MTSIKKGQKVIRFALNVDFYPAFGGIDNVHHAPNYDVLEFRILSVPDGGGEPKVSRKGAIDLSQYELEELCPTDNERQEEGMLIDEDEADALDVDDDASQSDFDDSDDASSSGDGARADDLDYIEKTWKDLIIESPDKFEFRKHTHRLFLEPDRQRLRLKLVEVELFLGKKKKKKTQSLPGKNILKNGNA